MGRFVSGREVTLASFLVGRTEVTVAEYAACVDAGACTTSPTGVDCNWGEPDRDGHPVNCADWHEARSYCEWAGGRLCSEAEWEYAARSGGLDIAYPWGNETATCEYAVMYDGGSGCGEVRTSLACSKPAGHSAQGACDLAGNVWEWLEDDWHPTYSGGPSDGTAWVDSPRGTYRHRRGGGFASNGSDLGASTRYYERPADTRWDQGFRCCRSNF